VVAVLRSGLWYLVGLEGNAIQQDATIPWVVPGLLQVADYARAVHAAGIPRLNPEIIDELGKQERSCDAANPCSRRWKVLFGLALRRLRSCAAVDPGQCINAPPKVMLFA
jgi:hypothetical protein